jgi:hypothetical protein
MNSLRKRPAIGRPGRSHKGWGVAGIALVLAIALGLIPACKDATTPESTVGTIYVINKSGATLDFYMDGLFRASVADWTSGTISDVLPGSHLVQGYLEGTQELVGERTIDVAAGAQYEYTISGVATISVTNQYGEVLKIYMDDTYVGDIGNNLTQTIHFVPFGTRDLVAKKRSDDTEVATISIDIVAKTDYPWIIVP